MLPSKLSDTPRIAPSMGTDLEDLKLERLSVVYPGTKLYAVLLFDG